MVRSAIIPLALVLIVGGFAWGQSPPEVARVTSDTADYCAQLAERAEAAAMTGEAKSLHDEGVLLCARGQVQAGIVRLRRALLLTRERQGK